MRRDTVLKELFTLVDHGVGPENLITDVARADTPGLVARAEEAFGSWEAFLASAVVHLRRRARGSDQPDDEPVAPPPERSVGPEAERPLLVWASDGVGYLLPLPLLDCRPTPKLRPLPYGPEGAAPRRALLLGDHPSLALVTSSGQMVRLDRRLVPTWDPGVDGAELPARFSDLAPDEAFVDAVEVQTLAKWTRLYALSAGGLIKATDSIEYPPRLGRDPIIATLIREG